MKSSIKSFVSLCAILSLSSGLALAQDNGPANVIIATDGCTFKLETGTTSDPVTGDLVAIMANSANGNINFTCTYDGEPTSTGRAVVLNYDNTDGGLCGYPGGTTEDWHQVISAKGKTKLICHVRN